MPFGLFETEQRARDERGRIEPFTPEEPGAFTGVGEGIGKGFMRGGARVAEAAGMAVAAPFVAYDMVTGRRTADSIFNVTTLAIDPAMEHWTPSPADVGMAGRVLGGFSEIGLPLMAGGGNPALLMGAMGLSEGAELVKGGASPAAATAVGMIQAGTLGVGFKIPYLGRTLAQRIGFGAGSNVALGVGSRAASSMALGNAPADLRARYDPMDAEAAVVDLLTGAVFGGIAHLATPSARDSTLVLNAAKHLEVDSAPGKATTDDARTAHVQAMEKATDQLMRGEPVNVSEHAARLDFEPSTIKDKAVAVFRKMVADVSKIDLPPAAIEERATKLQPASPVVTSNQFQVAELPPLQPGIRRLGPDEAAAAIAMRLAQQLSERVAGGSELPAVIERLARVYLERGPEDGRAWLENEAADAPESSEFSRALEEPGYVERLDTALREETDRWHNEMATVTPESEGFGKLLPLIEADDEAGFMQAIRSVAGEDGAPGGIPGKASNDTTLIDSEIPPSGGNARDGQATRPVGNPRREVERMEWDAAQQVARAHPDLEVVGPDGDVMPASELMEWADGMLQVAREDAAAITAAVECYLRS